MRRWCTARAPNRRCTNAPPGLLFYGDPGVPRSGRGAVKNLFAPRVGLAYALTGNQKTILRAGYGIYFNPSWSNIEGQFAIYQPFTRIIDINVSPQHRQSVGQFPRRQSASLHAEQDVVFDREIVGLSYGPNFKELSMQQWNLNIQHEFRRDWLMTVGYVGSRGTHIPYLRDANQAGVYPGRIHRGEHQRSAADGALLQPLQLYRVGHKFFLQLAAGNAR